MRIGPSLIQVHHWFPFSSVAPHSSQIFMMLMDYAGLLIYVCVVKLKHTNWCNANLLSLIVLCLNPISFNTLLSDVLPPEKTPSSRSFDCRRNNKSYKTKGSSVQIHPPKSSTVIDFLSCHIMNVFSV